MIQEKLKAVCRLAHMIHSMAAQRPLLIVIYIYIVNIAVGKNMDASAVDAVGAPAGAAPAHSSLSALHPSEATARRLSELCSTNCAMKSAELLDLIFSAGTVACQHCQQA